MRNAIGHLSTGLSPAWSRFCLPFTSAMPATRNPQAATPRSGKTRLQPEGPLAVSPQGMLERNQAEHQEQAAAEPVEQLFADPAADPPAGPHRQPGDQGMP